MDLPKTTEQQEAERRSYAILRYKLENRIGIFRNQTDSDYGIDFEIELKHEGRVTGRSIKAQVKSSKELKPRKDGKVRRTSLSAGRPSGRGAAAAREVAELVLDGAMRAIGLWR